MTIANTLCDEFMAKIKKFLISRENGLLGIIPKKPVFPCFYATKSTDIFFVT